MLKKVALPFGGVIQHQQTKNTWSFQFINRFIWWGYFLYVSLCNIKTINYEYENNRTREKH
jgi:hypothetical protein